MLEKSILMNWEKSRNLKSRDSSPLMEFAISKALFLYFYIENANTLSLTLTK